jgi:serine/threonine-protein kinase
VLVFIHVASALNHAHRRGVFHGDLKPGNIMLSRFGHVKVIDFGTAWLRAEPKGRIQGTPQYMAPEQANDKIVDERTDIYNFGAMMYRMVTGQHANLSIPGTADGLELGFRARLRPPIAIVPELPGTLNETIMACLEPSRDRRPAGVSVIKHQLVASARYLGLSPQDLRGSEDQDSEEAAEDTY